LIFVVQILMNSVLNINEKIVQNIFLVGGGLGKRSYKYL